MNAFIRTILVLQFAATALLPLTTAAQSKPPDASEEISKIIYSDLSKAEMLDRLAAFVRVGDKLQQVPGKTGLALDGCIGGGPGVMDCYLSNGLQLVADPDGVVQVIRRDAKSVGGRKFAEMSISTPILRWRGYVRGYAE